MARLSTPQRYAWAVMESKLTGRAKSVALVLSYHFNFKDLTCWPSLSYLAAMTGRSTSTVKVALNELEDGGYLLRNRRRIGTVEHDTTIYRPSIPGGTLAEYRPRGLAKKGSVGWPNTGQRSSLELTPPNAPEGARVGVCEECETGGGEHAVDCPKAVQP